MKRTVLLIMVLLLCVSAISCEETSAGVVNESEIPEAADLFGVPETMTCEIEPIRGPVIVDWSDFVRVNGQSYDGYFKNETIDESRVGERLGEILYNVKSSYSSEEEMNAACQRDFVAAFRPIGCEIFAVKDDEYSIAVLDNGKYYIYTVRTHHMIPFSVFGGEAYGFGEKNMGVVINTFDQLCEAYGGAENVPDEIRARYSGDGLSDISLVLVGLLGTSGGMEFGIGSVAIMTDELYVKAYRFETDAEGDDVLYHWTFFIEIAKTGDKSVEVRVERCQPLVGDFGLEKADFKKTDGFSSVQSEAHRRYEGQTVLNRYAAEEVLCGMYEYQLSNIEVMYDPTFNYWIMKHSTNNDKVVYTAIRAADGKLISTWESN